jgi:hypothetical protein
MAIDYGNMTPAQVHFAGRLNDLTQTEVSYGFVVTRIGETTGLLLKLPEDAPWNWVWNVDPETFTVHHRADLSDSGDIYPANVYEFDIKPLALADAGYDLNGQSRSVNMTGAPRSGIVLPTDAVDTALMELPEGWTDTGILMALELAGIDMNTTLNHSQLARVIEALTEHEDAERVALWVTEVSGYSHQLNEAIDHAEDWARWESDAYAGHWDSGAEYAEEWVLETEAVPDVLRYAIDWDAVWDELRHDLTYAEDGGEIWLYS